MANEERGPLDQWFEMLNEDYDSIIVKLRRWVDEVESALGRVAEDRIAEKVELIVADLLHSTPSTVKGYRSKARKGNFLGLFCNRLEKAQAFGLDHDLSNKLLDLHTRDLLELKLSDERRRWAQSGQHLQQVAAQSEEERRDLDRRAADLSTRENEYAEKVRALEAEKERLTARIEEVKRTETAFAHLNLRAAQIDRLREAFLPIGLLAPRGWESAALLTLTLRLLYARQIENEEMETLARRECLLQEQKELVFYVWTWPFRKVVNAVMP